jgi:hypothetical protein
VADGKSITLQMHELPAYRAAVIVCAHADERERCERLLGQLASLEAQGDAAVSQLRFAPPSRSAVLARRALEHLRRSPAR